VGVPAEGNTVRLATIELPSRYAGQLEYFAQFTDRQATHPDEINTPELEWLLLVNGRPLAPYINLTRIINPWGCCSFPLQLRLDRGSRLELAVRRVPRATDITSVGGRIAGRSWFDDV
jgi:hypothetical protein